MFDVFGIYYIYLCDNFVYGWGDFGDFCCSISVVGGNVVWIDKVLIECIIFFGNYNCGC